MPYSTTDSLRLLALASLPLLAQAESTQTLPTLYIDAQQTANSQSATTYQSPVSNLEFEPRIDLQARSMAEAQSDVTIRGGIFENTGFRVGSATLIDPQTGHYFAELPIAPEMLTRPEVLTGTENALYGFNSTVGTISYGWSQIQDGGSATIGGGDHELNFQRIHHGLTHTLDKNGAWSWGIEAEVSRSESDGTRRHGGHDFDRTTARAQILGPNSQTDLFAGYQAKKFSWPNMYTPPNPPFIGAIEFERLKTRLFILNHRQSYGSESWFEATAFHRRHTDDYLLDAQTFDFPISHETKVSSLGLAGFHELSQATGLNYSAQAATDSIDSTSLENTFTSRDSFKLSLFPQYNYPINNEEKIILRAGVSFDDSNRDDSEVSTLFDLRWHRTRSNGRSDSIYLAYAETSQVAGYTAIGGSPSSGVFRSQPDLARETSQNLELGFSMEAADWSLEASVFNRWDADLVDWTYSNNPFARSASPVDIETLGLEIIGTRRWGTLEGIASYTYLHKTADYSDATIQASFYALNYARHRLTLGAIWRPIENLELRIDNEWRTNQANTLRNSRDSALFTHFALSIYPPQVAGLEIFFAIDNAWEDDFEDVPGTPGRGDQYSAGVTFRW